MPTYMPDMCILRAARPHYLKHRKGVPHVRDPHEVNSPRYSLHRRRSAVWFLAGYGTVPAEQGTAGSMEREVASTDWRGCGYEGSVVEICRRSRAGPERTKVEITGAVGWGC